MALIADYFAKTKQYQDEYGQRTILLMQVGAFFEVYGIKTEPLHPEPSAAADFKIISGSKIQMFSQICELNIVDKNTSVLNDPNDIGKSKVLMAGFKDFQIDKYVSPHQNKL